MGIKDRGLVYGAGKENCACWGFRVSSCGAVFYAFGLWRNWAIYLEPLEGIILGPWAGFLAALIGSVIGRIIKPIDFWMFGVIAEPLGVLAAGFLARVLGSLS